MGPQTPEHPNHANPASAQHSSHTLQGPFGSLEAAKAAANAAGRPYVIGQLGQSLDGRIATPTGDSRYINGSCALDHLHALRARVDAVLVGAGTVAADDPQLNVRRVPGRSPARVVLDPSARTGACSRWLADDGARRILITCEDGDAPAGCDERITIAREPGAAGGRVCPHAVAQALFARGLRSVLIEGGARTISMFIDAGAMDRLHVLVAPVIIGSGKSGLDLAPITALSGALRPSTGVFPFPDGDVLFDCDLRAREAP